MLQVAAILAGFLALRGALVVWLQCYLSRIIRTGSTGPVADFIVRRKTWISVVLYVAPTPLPAALAAQARSHGLSMESLALLFIALYIAIDIVASAIRLWFAVPVEDRPTGRELPKTLTYNAGAALIAAGLCVWMWANAVPVEAMDVFPVGIWASFAGVFVLLLLTRLFGTVSPAPTIGVEGVPLTDECLAILARFTPHQPVVLFRPRRATARPATKYDIQRAILLWTEKDLKPESLVLPAELVHNVEPSSLTAFLSTALAGRFPVVERLGLRPGIAHALHVLSVSGVLMILPIIQLSSIDPRGSDLSPAWFAVAVTLFVLLLLLVNVQARWLVGALPHAAGVYALGFQVWRDAVPSLKRDVDDFVRALFRMDLETRVYSDASRYRQFVRRNKPLRTFLAAYGHPDFDIFLDEHLEPMLRAASGSVDTPTGSHPAPPLNAHAAAQD